MPTAVEAIRVVSSYTKRCCLHFQNWFQTIGLAPLATAQQPSQALVRDVEVCRSDSQPEQVQCLCLGQRHHRTGDAGLELVWWWGKQRKKMKEGRIADRCRLRSNLVFWFILIPHICYYLFIFADLCLTYTCVFAFFCYLLFLCVLGFLWHCFGCRARRPLKSLSQVKVDNWDSRFEMTRDDLRRLQIANLCTCCTLPKEV